MDYKIVITQQDVDEFNSQYFAEHSRAKKPRIRSPQHPSLNEYITANNFRGNTLKQDWKDFIIYVLSKNNLLNIGIDKCEIIYRTYFKINKIRDLDNITPKYIFDGLIDGGFIVADDYRHIRRLTIEGDVDRENPRIELEIKVL